MTRTPSIGVLIRALEELARIQRESSSRLARELGCARASLPLLRLLHDGGPQHLGDVAAQLRVDLSVASRHVTALVDTGYVHRAVDDGDRRARQIALTPTGKALLDRCDERMSELTEQTFADWSDEDLHTVAHAIDRVTTAITKSASLLATAP